MKIAKGVNTKHQYNFLIKSFNKKGTFCQIEKITVTPYFTFTIYTSRIKI